MSVTKKITGAHASVGGRKSAERRCVDEPFTAFNRQGVDQGQGKRHYVCGKQAYDAIKKNYFQTIRAVAHDFDPEQSAKPNRSVLG
jgi:hypothetical protein